MYITLNNKKIDVQIAKTTFQKMKGLSFKNTISYGLLIPNCISIHTFFMKDNIDVLVLNNKNSILYKFQNTPPKRILAFEEDIKKTSILELPKNTSNDLKIGDVLTFEFEDII